MGVLKFNWVNESDKKMVGKRSKNKKHTSIKVRNPIAMNPQMKKSHVHDSAARNGSKAERAKVKVAIKRGFEDL